MFFVNINGYEVPDNYSEKSKKIIQTLSECGCVEVEFNDESIEISNELLKFAANYGLIAYKKDYSLILCDNPVKHTI